MEPARMDSRGPTPAMSAAPAAPATPAAGLLDIAHALWRDVRAIVLDHVELAALETQRAGRSLVHMLIYGLAAGLLLVIAWLGLMGAAALWLIALGLSPGAALLLLSALNVGAAYVLYLMIGRSSRDLSFPATLRSLQADATLAAQPDKP